MATPPDINRHFWKKPDHSGDHTNRVILYDWPTSRSCHTFLFLVFPEGKGEEEKVIFRLLNELLHQCSRLECNGVLIDPTSEDVYHTFCGNDTGLRNISMPHLARVAHNETESCYRLVDKNVLVRQVPDGYPSLVWLLEIKETILA